MNHGPPSRWNRKHQKRTALQSRHDKLVEELRLTQRLLFLALKANGPVTLEEGALKDLGFDAGVGTLDLDPAGNPRLSPRRTPA